MISVFGKVRKKRYSEVTCKLQAIHENRSQVMGMRGSAISLAIMLGPLAQALIGPWTTPQTTFAIGVALSVSMALWPSSC